LVLSFSFFRQTLLGAWPDHEKLSSDSVSGSKFLRQSFQLMQCSRSFQRIFPSRFSSETPFWATSRAMTCSLLTLYQTFKILKKLSVTKKKYLKISPIIW
jgi:hypothetical protein